ncbi:MAG: hydratase [Eubacteriales bacterium]|nr:hydratase [Eubacteriales bacterium]
MIDVRKSGAYLHEGKFKSIGEIRQTFSDKEISEAFKGTMTYSVLSAHSVSGAYKGEPIHIRFDAIASHDITYVGIIQSAKASGLKRFPLPYVLTNCHNSLCAVGGTINEDDHVFGLSAARKYGGIYVPANVAVIHTYMREKFAGAGKMILGSDSHTRYGAFGTLAIGEGGPELVKQLLGRTYDVRYPEVVAVRLTGNVRHGVGPQDVALAIIGAVFGSGAVKNKVLEFIGDGVSNLDMEFRNGIDVMTTETACLSSLWITDDKTRDYLEMLGRPDDYKEMRPEKLAFYDAAVTVDLSEIEPMIALPFHPSNVYRLKDVIENPGDIFSKVEKDYVAVTGADRPALRLTDKIRDGKVFVSQGIIAGCSGGTFANIAAAANVLKGADTGNGAFSLSVYPGSMPVYLDLMKKGYLSALTEAGAVIKPCFCGPCFGAGDTPCNNGLSIRHTTRNFENREGSKPSGRQIAAVALMDARSIAATAKNGGVLTSAADVDYDEKTEAFRFDEGIYEKRVYNGWRNPRPEENLVYGPNIRDWPEIDPMPDNLILKVAAAISDPVTTTDELIPSGETSSLRSNPLRLAEFTLSRKCPDYVSRAKKIKAEADAVKNGVIPEDVRFVLEKTGLKLFGTTALGSVVCAVKPGDGSAREQAASCQRVLGAAANIAKEYATKRYRSNLINWGMLPLISDEKFEVDDLIVMPDAKARLIAQSSFSCYLLRKGKIKKITLNAGVLTNAERDIILAGSLINYYAENAKKED